ncbi:MAG TPA: hypothetical protein VMW95_09225, partial [Desulfobacterales bacterium]|nr:hypothetical protein [Desulfobacterales bacterium]
MKISNTITVSGNIFYKINIQYVRHIKLIPCYDIEYGVVIKMIAPPQTSSVLDKSWMAIDADVNNELFRFRCPSFLLGYIGRNAEEYEDRFPSTGEICRIRLIGGDFIGLKDMIKVPRKISYHPYFSKDGRIHISFAYIRKYFPKFLKKNLYVSPASTTQTMAVINKEIVVFVLSGTDLDKDEYAAKF